MLYEERKRLSCPDGDGISKGKKGVIVFSVLLVHCIVGVLPLLIIFTAPPPEKVYVDKVVLVDSEPNDNTIPSLFPGKSPEPNNEGLPPPPPPVDDTVPELPDPAPEVVPPSPPKVEPAVTTKTPPVPVKKQDPKAPAIKKVKEKPKKKVEQKQKTKPKPSREEQIRKWREAQLKKRPRKSPSSPQKTTRTTTDNSQRNKNLQDLADILRGRDGGVPGGTGTKAAGGAGGTPGEYDPARASALQAYWQRISGFLRARWINKPNLNALGNLRPTVRVTFTVTGTGVITSMKMQPSGVAVMDSSVAGLLKSIRQLPRPPGNKPLEFWVDLEVE